MKYKENKKSENDEIEIKVEAPDAEDAIMEISEIQAEVQEPRGLKAIGKKIKGIRWKRVAKNIGFAVAGAAAAGVAFVCLRSKEDSDEDVIDVEPDYVEYVPEEVPETEYIPEVTEE